MKDSAVIKQVFNWASGQTGAAVARNDIATFKKAVVLAAICLDSEEEAAIIRTYIVTLEENNGPAFTDVKNVVADIPFFIVCYKLTGRLSPEVYDKLADVQLAIKNDIEINGNWRALAVFLLIDQLIPLGLNIAPPPLEQHLKKPLAYYFSADANELNELIAAIHISSGFGTRKIVNKHKMLQPILEVRMIQALRNYELIPASYILTALQYLGVKNKNASTQAVNFLINNQTEAGFIGYYEREFQNMKMESPAQRTNFLLTSTLISVIALLEQDTAYRFYQNIFRRELEFAACESM